MKHQKEVEEILTNIGGRDNIVRMTHCMTRLRFNLKDNHNADLDKLGEIDGVINTQIQNGQLQVVIGPAVADWYDEMAALTGLDDDSENSATETENNQKGIIGKLLEILSNIFLPVIPAIAGAGMMKALLGLLVAFSFVSQKSDTYLILNLMADTTFYFLPFLLAISASKLFKTNTVLAGVLAGALLYPTMITQVGKIASYHFVGLPIPVLSYSASVIPIILSVWLMSYVYRFVDRHMPDMLKVIFVPTVVLLIMIPIELIALGPLGNYMGEALSSVSMKLFSMSGLLAGFIMGGLRPLMVITGMHQAITPVIFQNFASKGYDVLMPTMIMSTFAQAAGVLTMVVKTRSHKEKSVIYSSGISAILGITEPALYGVIIKYKRLLASVCIGGGLGSAYVSMMGYHLGSFAPSNVLSLAVYAMSPKFVHVIIGMLISIISTVVMVLIFQPVVGKEDKKAVIGTANDTELATQNAVDIHAPISGSMVSLAEVPDTTFASGAMGDGFAIIPDKGSVQAPFDGTVIVVASTGHAIGLRSDSGVEILIHIGIDTVELNGKYFNTLVAQGQKVTCGEELITFDLDKVKSQYNVISPVIITNGDLKLNGYENHIDIAEGQLLAVAN